MKKIFNLILFILIIFSLELFSQNNLLNSLQNKFNSLASFSAEFQQLTNDKPNLVGKFYYKKENKIRLELKNLLIVSDGLTTWNFNKKENKVIINNYNDDDTSILSLNKIINDYPNECTVKEINDNGINKLILKPKTNNLNFKSAELYINTKNLIDKVIIEDFNSNKITIIFSNYILEKDFSNSYFSFKLPKGTQVIDLR